MSSYWRESGCECSTADQNGLPSTVETQDELPTAPNNPEATLESSTRPTIAKLSVSRTKADVRHPRLLKGMNMGNIIELEKDARDTSSPPPSAHTLRDCRPRQSKLIYDSKYHPMDDVIRPSQAAKRRTVHGEPQSFDEESYNSCSEHSKSGGYEEIPSDNGIPNDNERNVEDRFPCRSMRKKHKTDGGSEPTRRSLRKSKPNISYNGKIHPQDEQLRILDEEEAEFYKTKRKPKGCSSPISTTGLSSHEAVSDQDQDQNPENEDVTDQIMYDLRQEALDQELLSLVAEDISEETISLSWEEVISSLRGHDRKYSPDGQVEKYRYDGENHVTSVFRQFPGKQVDDEESLPFSSGHMHHDDKENHDPYSDLEAELDQTQRFLEDVWGEYRHSLDEIQEAQSDRSAH